MSPWSLCFPIVDVLDFELWSGVKCIRELSTQPPWFLFLYFTILTDTLQQKHTERQSQSPNGSCSKWFKMTSNLLERAPKQAAMQAGQGETFWGRDFLIQTHFFSSPNRGKRQLVLLQGYEEYVPGVNWLWQVLPCFIFVFPLHPRSAHWVTGITKMCTNPSVAAIVLSITVIAKLIFKISVIRN